MFLDLFREKFKQSPSKLVTIKPDVTGNTNKPLVNIIKVVEHNTNPRLEEIAMELSAMEQKRERLLIEREKLTRMLQIVLE
jgi:hypothetical protein